MRFIRRRWWLTAQNNLPAASLKRRSIPSKIRQSRKKPESKYQLNDTNLKIEISGLPDHDAAYVWFVITEDNLQTNVRRGENSGKKLPHTAVVREMKLLDTLAENAKSFSVNQKFALQTGWEKKNLNLIVFVQGKNSKSIFAVGKKRLV